MPNYDYECPVCSQRVKAGTEYCNHCGCPAELSGYELNARKQQWLNRRDDLETSSPVSVHRSRRATWLRNIQLLAIAPASIFYGVLGLFFSLQLWAQILESAADTLLTGNNSFHIEQFVSSALISAALFGLFGLWQAILSFGKVVNLWLLIPGIAAALVGIVMWFVAITALGNAIIGIVLGSFLIPCLLCAAYFVAGKLQAQFSSQYPTEHGV